MSRGLAHYVIDIYLVVKAHVSFECVAVFLCFLRDISVREDVLLACCLNVFFTYL